MYDSLYFLLFLSPFLCYTLYTDYHYGSNLMKDCNNCLHRINETCYLINPQFDCNSFVQFEFDQPNYPTAPTIRSKPSSGERPDEPYSLADIAATVDSSRCPPPRYAYARGNGCGTETDGRVQSRRGGSSGQATVVSCSTSTERKCGSIAPSSVIGSSSLERERRSSHQTEL